MFETESERREEQAAAAEAARIGTEPSSDPAPETDEAQRPLQEAGQGEAEGYEESERELIEHATHGDQHAARRIAQVASHTSEDERAVPGGEGDAEKTSERPEDTR
jgi:hypothetical protein